jgi:hypothetical protein
MTAPFPLIDAIFAFARARAIRVGADLATENYATSTTPSAASAGRPGALAPGLRGLAAHAREELMAARAARNVLRETRRQP